MSITRGIVGCWSPSLGATGYLLRDVSGLNNHGTLTNMDPGTDWMASPVGLSLDFDGTNDFISLRARAGDLTETLPFSVSAWALARTTGSFRSLLSRDESYPFPFAIRFNGGSTLNLTCDGGNLTGPIVPTNVWFHYVATLSPSLRTISLSGVQSVQSTASYTITANNDELRIGTDYIAAANRVWDGLIGEIAIYNRALTAPEIAELYRRGNGWLGRELTGMNQRRTYAKKLGNRRRRLLCGGMT